MQQQLLVRNPISAPEGTELPLWSLDWKHLTRVNSCKDSSIRRHPMEGHSCGLKPVQPQCFLTHTARDSSDHVLSSTTTDRNSSDSWSSDFAALRETAMQSWEVGEDIQLIFTTSFELVRSCRIVTLAQNTQYHPEKLILNN